eukprot:9002430-Alexandrium_andersonii.AAC.1
MPAARADAGQGFSTEGHQNGALASTKRRRNTRNLMGKGVPQHGCTICLTPDDSLLVLLGPWAPQSHATPS